MTEVAFDPEKPRNRDYVRVKVKFDVSKPVRREKVVNLPSGEVTSILYDYERVQKRCCTCQRLTHDQEVCPLFLINQPKKGEESVTSSTLGKSKQLVVL